jgi:hypothetical protein
MWRKVIPFALALFTVATVFLAVKYFGSEAEIKKRDHQIISLMQVNYDIEDLMENDSVKAYLVRTLGDSVFVKEASVSKEGVVYQTDTIYRDNIIYQTDTVYRNRYFTVKTKNAFKGTQKEFEMYRDSMITYRNALFSLQDRFDSLAYAYGEKVFELQEKDRMQQISDEKIADMGIVLDSTNAELFTYKSEKDSLEKEILEFYNSTQGRKFFKKKARKEKSNGLSLGVSMHAGLGAMLHDGEPAIGPTISAGVGIVAPIHRQK